MLFPVDGDEPMVEFLGMGSGIMVDELMLSSGTLWVAVLAAVALLPTLTLAFIKKTTPPTNTTPKTADPAAANAISVVVIFDSPSVESVEFVKEQGSKTLSTSGKDWLWKHS